MLCANQQMIAESGPLLEREKPVVLDWLLWSHTFAGNSAAVLNRGAADVQVLYAPSARE